MIFKLVLSVLYHSLIVTYFVFGMMVLIDIINVLTEDRFRKWVRGNISQYIIGALLGAFPGCLGAFISVSLYAHGIISFGAITSTMIATSGDEQFMMLFYFPDKALLIFAGLFLLAIPLGYLTDIIAKKFNLIREVCCEVNIFHKGERIFYKFSKEKTHLVWRLIVFFIFTGVAVLFLKKVLPVEKKIMMIFLVSISFLLGLSFLILSEHYIKEHIIEHILKSHIIKTFLWVFAVLLGFKILDRYVDLARFIKSNLYLMIFISALIGLIPESGPHLIFTILFAKGKLPLSIFITNSIVQDGHGLLPLLAYNWKEALKIKIFNLIYGIVIGLILLIAGF